MEKMYKFCQSCMMPFKKDPKGGGTNADGTKSSMYCSYCHQNGKFTQPDISAKEMREFVVNKMVEMKYSRFMAKFLTMGLGNLERWKNAKK